MNMIRNSRWMLAAAVSGTLAVAAMPAHARNISMPDSCTMQQSGSDYVISCTNAAPAPTPPPTPAPTPTPTAPPPTPTPTGTISCAGAGTTRVVDVAWPASGFTRVLTTTSTGNDATVFRVTVPANMPVSASSYGRFNGGYNSDQQANREIALSATPCDFSSSLALGAYEGVSNSIFIPFSIGNGDGYYPGLAPGATYYLNVRNVDCAQGANCNMYLDVYRP